MVRFYTVKDILYALFEFLAYIIKDCYGTACLLTMHFLPTHPTAFLSDRGSPPSFCVIGLFGGESHKPSEPGELSYMPR